MRPALGFPILIVILICRLLGIGTGIKNRITIKIKIRIRNATSIHGVSTYAKKRAAPGCL